MDPENVKIVVAQIADHFSRVAPASAQTFAANLAAFNATLNAKIPQWQAALAPHRGAKIVTYHNDFVYLASRYGLEVVGTLEPKPGIAPSPAHIAELISTMKGAGAHVILVQPYQNRRTAETVARQTEAAVLNTPQQPGAIPNTPGYFELMDNTVRTLATALGGAR